MHYLNTAATGSSHTYTNNTQSAQNLLVTITGGDGSLDKSIFQSGNFKYWRAGARGVEVQVFVNDVLQDSALGGLGNPQSTYDAYEWSHSRRWKCGWFSYCTEEIYAWKNYNYKIKRAGSGDSKSFVLNLSPGQNLTILFKGNANIKNTNFNGSAYITLLPDTPPKFEPTPMPPSEIAPPSEVLPEGEIVPPSQTTPQEPEAPESKTPPPNPPIEENAPTEPKQS